MRTEKRTKHRGEKITKRKGTPESSKETPGRRIITEKGGQTINKNGLRAKAYIKNAEATALYRLTDSCPAD